MAPGQPIVIPSAETFNVTSRAGYEYVINIGYPRKWQYENIRQEGETIPIMYLTDGNSIFHSSLEELHRRLSFGIVGTREGVVVSIGYQIPPETGFLFEIRRSWDFTPDQSLTTGQKEGGAAEFIEFLEETLKPFVSARLMEKRGLSPGREALFGHSHGGLFCLHTLFTRPDLFDCFLASSPSISWHNEFVLHEEKAFVTAAADETARKPSLMLFVGGQESTTQRRREEPDEVFDKREQGNESRDVVGRTIAMYDRLKECPRLEHVSLHVYDAEDHCTAIPCALTRSFATFLDEWA